MLALGIGSESRPIITNGGSDVQDFKPKQFWPYNENSNLRIIVPDTGKEARDIYNVLGSIVRTERDAYWPHKEPK